MSVETAFLSARLPAALRNRLKAVAATRGVSLQSLMRDALEELLRREEAEPPKLAEVLARLREHAPELRTRGVQHLYVFGSVARGDARADSDVDLAIEIDPTSDFSLITLGSLTADVEEWLNRSVDLGERSMLRPSLRADFERDVVRVF
ncbi:MAG: nucleotidyltransferase domain-containing protein [Geminicoccaceae bacterium]